MKTFSNLKRDIRTFYKPKSKNPRREDDQDTGSDSIEAQCAGPGVQLASRTPRVTDPDEVQATRGSDSHTDPTGSVGADAQAATDDHESVVSSNRKASSEHFDPTATSRSASAAEQSQGDSATSLAESEQEYQDSIAEETELLTFEEAQALRDQAYRTFACEEPEDFTDGPTRIIVASDNIKRCAALLVPYDLSQKIQEALQGQHDFSRIEREGLFRRQSLLRLEDDTGGRGPDEDAQKLQQQMANLQLMLPDITLRKQKASVDVDMHAKRLRGLQAAVNAHLEEAFICAHLIAPYEKGPEPEIEKLDVSQEYLEFCQRLEGPDDFVFEDIVAPLDNNRDYPEVPPPSEEEQARQAVINSLWAAKEALDIAHQDFDNRENDRAREYEANVQAADRGDNTTDDSPEAFDVRWVIRFRDLTRALIDAEAAYADVKRMAFEAGVPLPFTDNESVFKGVGDDTGYTISKEQDLMDSAPSPTVRKWLSKVPEGGETGSVGEEAQLEADEWDAEEVGISDSVSLVAEGRQRSMIDRWQNACLAEKSQ